MRIKHVIGIAFTCMVFIFSCQAQSSTESHAGKNKQEQKIKPRHLTKAEFLSKVSVEIAAIMGSCCEMGYEHMMTKLR